MPKPRRISKWHAPARPPRVPGCWQSVPLWRSTRRDRPTAPPPRSRRPARAGSWRRSIPGCACARRGSRATRPPCACSSPTCRPRRRTSVRDACIHVERALREDSSAATLLFYAELLVASGRLREAVRAYGAATRDSAARPLALYRRARVLVRLGDSAAVPGLSSFAQSYPADSAAPGALYVLADMLEGRDDWANAARWYGELISRYPADPRASLARFRLAAHAESAGQPDSAALLYQSEIDANGPQRTAARFWLGKMAEARGDTTRARTIWLALAHEDSLGYYGMRARREIGLPALAFAAPPAQPAPPAPPAPVVLALARIGP